MDSSKLTQIARRAHRALVRSTAHRRRLAGARNGSGGAWVEREVRFAEKMAPAAIRVLAADVKRLKLGRFARWNESRIPKGGADVCVVEGQDVCLRAVAEYIIVRDETRYILSVIGRP